MFLNAQTAKFFTMVTGKTSRNTCIYFYHCFIHLFTLSTAVLAEICCLWTRPWWRHQMETLSALLAICAGNSPVMWRGALMLSLIRVWINGRVNKQSWGWWFETLSRPSWRHRNESEISDNRWKGQFQKSYIRAFHPVQFPVNDTKFMFPCPERVIVAATLSSLTSSFRGCHHDSFRWELQWRHNGLDGVSNQQPHHCLYILSRLLGRRSKKTSKRRVTGLCAGNSPRTGEFLAQMASNAENVSIWWRHHGLLGWPCWLHCGCCSKILGHTSSGFQLPLPSK